MSKVNVVPVAPSSLVFDKQIINHTNKLNMLMLDAYANANCLFLMKRAARGQAPPNNFGFKFNDLGNMGMQAAIQSNPNQWMALQQANQSLPAQPQGQQIDLAATIGNLDKRLDAIDAKFEELNK
jgi:hypothetical protein